MSIVIRYCLCACLLVVVASAGFAFDEIDDMALIETPAERDVWPAEAEQAGHFGGKNVQQLEQALKAATEALKTLKHQTTVVGPAFAGRSMKGQPGFRAIYSMNRDGSDVQFLTAAPGMISNADPQVSHDGTMLTFNSFPQPDAVQEGRLFVYAMEGPFKGSFRDLGYGSTPAWSPDDKQIAYCVNAGTPIGAKFGLWVMNADGSDRRWLAEGYFPRWSPDGRKLVFHGFDNAAGRMALNTVNVETGKIRTLLTAPGWDIRGFGGNWSASGDRVVFIGRFQGHDRLATINSDGDDESIRVLATASEGQSWSGPPEWSPDGRQVVFSVEEEAAESPRKHWNSHLYSLNLEDKEAKPKLLEGKKIGNVNRGMEFMPDGKRILFSSER